MIYFIITKSPHAYLSAICTEKESIENYFDGLPESIRADSEILHFKHVDMPCWMIEYDEFEFHNEETILEAIKRAASMLKNGEDFFNLYWIEDDYLPEDKGIDQMGSLNHRHFSKKEVYTLKEDGLKKLMEYFNVKYEINHMPNERIKNVKRVTG